MHDVVDVMKLTAADGGDDRGSGDVMRREFIALPVNHHNKNSILLLARL